MSRLLMILTDVFGYVLLYSIKLHLPLYGQSLSQRVCASITFTRITECSQLFSMTMTILESVIGGAMPTNILLQFAIMNNWVAPPLSHPYSLFPSDCSIISCLRAKNTSLLLYFIFSSILSSDRRPIFLAALLIYQRLQCLFFSVCSSLLQFEEVFEITLSIWLLICSICA